MTTTSRTEQQETPAALRAGAGREWAFVGAVFFMMASAVPMSFFYYVVPPMLRELGHSPEIIGGFAVVYLPYVLRGLWAFLLGRFLRGEARRFRLATVGFAVAGAGAVLGLIPLDPTSDVGAIILVAVICFVILASGMTTLDGYLLATLSPEDRASSSAWSAAGVAFGGVIVGLMAWFEIFSTSWTNAIIMLAGATLLPALLVLLLPSAPGAKVLTADPNNTEFGALRGLFAERQLRMLILVAVIAHGSIGLVSGYLPVLQVDAGLNISEIGLFSAVAANVIGLASAVIGGAIVARRGPWQALAFVTAFMALTLLIAGALYETLWGKSFALVLTGALMMAGYIYLVPYRALILSACDGPHGVNQVAILSSFDMCIGVIAMMLAGVVAVQLGLTLFFLACAALALLASLMAVQHAARNRGARPNDDIKLEY